MILVMRLRSKQATLHELEVEAAEAYPSRRQADQSMRSRVKRLMRASDTDYGAAVAAYKAGRNVNEIVATTATPTSCGAPLGNTNRVRKRTKPVLPRLNALWRVAGSADRAAFLLQNGLSPITDLTTGVAP